MQVRLQKILSAGGISSRRAAEQLILQGRVSVNGTTVRELGTRADPERDVVKVDGRRVRSDTRRRYVLLNKPRGYLSTRSDPRGRPTVFALLKGVREYLYPVGRLDFDSEGLLLLTNDGELALRMTHPRHRLEREYHARVRGILDEKSARRLATGVVIAGRRTAPATVKILRGRAGQDRAESTVALTIREGRKRQVRYMFEGVGHPVMRLKRVRLGPIESRGLKPGAARELDALEVRALKTAVGLIEPGRRTPTRKERP
jgi:pseudouridine synthase